MSAATNVAIAERLRRADTFVKLVRLNAREHGQDIAIREKDFGIWRSWTWSQYLTLVREIALGLKALSIGKGDVVALIGDNRPGWLAGEMAAHALGAFSLGIYRDALEEELEYLLNYGAASVILVEDEEQVDKLLNLEDRLPHLKHIVYFDPRGMRKYDDPRLLASEALQAKGRQLHKETPELFDALVDATKADDVAVLCTTSGTTGHPKLAMLSAGAVLQHCAAYLEADPKTADDEYVSVLPLPWIMEQIYAVGMAVLSRMKVNFVEEPDTTMNDFREIAPTFVLYAPRIWESVAADVRARIMDTTPLKRWLYQWGLSQGMQALAKGKRSRLADLILFRPLRDRLGFNRLKSAATGGAALGPDTFKFFLALGVPLRQLYGQTELLGAYTLHLPDAVDFNTVGVPMRGVEVRIDEPDADGIGEIITRHGNMFKGYYKNEEASRADFKEDWLKTGDAGYFNGQNQLVVIDRVKDLASTATAHRFSPQYIENKLKFSPSIAEAVVLGAGSDYLTAILCIRYSIVSKWAEKKRIAFTTYTDLASKPEVYNLLEKDVIAVNESLPASQRIARFVLLYKELDADDGELTRTRKVRRGVIAEKYADIIEAIYSDRPTIDIDTTIRFQDGTSQRVRTKLKVARVPGSAAGAGSPASQAKKQNVKELAWTHNS